MARRNVNIFNIRTKKKNKVYINLDTNCKTGDINGKKVYLRDNTFIESLLKYIGQTITIYIISGGAAGTGFTGVLLEVKKDYIKILSKAMSPPQINIEGCYRIEDVEDKYDDSSLGIITNIQIDKIAAFVHNVI